MVIGITVNQIHALDALQQGRVRCDHPKIVMEKTQCSTAADKDGVVFINSGACFAYQDTVQCLVEHIIATDGDEVLCNGIAGAQCLGGRGILRHGKSVLADGTDLTGREGHQQDESNHYSNAKYQ